MKTNLKCISITTIILSLAIASLHASDGVMSVPFAGTAGMSETDRSIESKALNSYVFKTILKDDAVKIESNNGDVTLMGVVSDKDHKQLAQDTLENLPGVKKVDNQIEVKSGELTENSDMWISMKVKSALLFHRNVSGVGTQVAVKDGIVTLRGEVPSESQKELTGKYAKDIDGVKEVINNINVVVPSEGGTKNEETIGEVIDDASITAQVKLNLMTNKGTSALNTKVTTENGNVTVTGTAKDAAEKDLVIEIIKDIKGVKNVVNNMTIENKTT